MQFKNADVVKKFIFRYLNLPLTNGSRNILVNITNKDILNIHRVNPPEAD
jgi:hypothetical protein